MKYLATFIFILLLTYSCTPFDSNAYNKRMIQYEWLQVEIAFPNERGDSLIVEKPKGITILTFSGDTCLEQMPDIDTIHIYRYDIKDYVLKLEKDSLHVNYFDISKLADDSLILYTDFRIWKYIKKAD